MTPTPQTPDLIVVGSGVIGSAVAYYAARSGLSVSVLEARKFGGQGSSVAAGLIAPSPQITGDTPFSRLASASLALFPRLRDQLLDETGIDIQLDPRGALRVAVSEDDAHEQQRLLPVKQQLGFNLSWLSPCETRTLEPTLSERIHGAVYGPDEAQINTLRLLAAYRAGAEQHGARFLKMQVMELAKDGRKVMGVLTPDGSLGAGHVVIAGGAWAGQLAEVLRAHVPIQPQRGQLVVMRNTLSAPRHIIFWGDVYLAPQIGGAVTIGAANDYPGFVLHPTAEGVARLLKQALEAFPDLASAPFLGARAGLRPRTPDKLPIIGPIPGWEGISVAAGHNSNGLLFSAITGQAIAALVMQAPTPLDLNPYRPDRFENKSATRPRL